MGSVWRLPSAPEHPKDLAITTLRSSVLVNGKYNLDPRRLITKSPRNRNRTTVRRLGPLRPAMIKRKNSYRGYSLSDGKEKDASKL
jgi:hypothetical protein